jgi:ABC-type transport system substrate-binding protein
MVFRLLQSLMACLIVFVSPTTEASWVLNNPYPANQTHKSIFYSSFNDQPKTLDPARAYTINEYQIIEQIYEPVLSYDYFVRPHQLVPLTAVDIPKVRYLDKQAHPISLGQGDIAYSIYTISIKPGILFQPHPAFAKDEQNRYRYLELPRHYLIHQNISQLSDFTGTGTREVLADDYVYQIKRLASPNVNSPIYGLLAEHILGFRDYASSLPAAKPNTFLDLREYPLSGIKKLDDYTFEITIIGQYQQFLYWLAMPFFVPVPWEADKFYSQKGMDDKNITLDWYPVGTGPFMLSENNPNRRMVLDKNPNFRAEFFPSNGSNEDKEKGYLKHAGELIPLIDRAIYTLEKESIPRWNKFLQGYYDRSSISSDSFDQVIHLDESGHPYLTQAMIDKKMQLDETLDPSIYYMGFNMLDPIVGGSSERARKLRMAISIAVDYEENISLFYNGRGHAAQGPIPEGIFGYKEDKTGINPYVYEWDGQKPKRRSLTEARRLMSEAGYPNGLDPATGKALILHYDVSLMGGPDDKSQLDWMRKQFASLGIDLDIRSTEYNRFQEKLRSGNAQIFSWGWSADYPDPENFLFILYGLNGKVAHGGENSTNYQNNTYDRLFEQMKNTPDGPRRQKIIDSMVDIVRYEAPMVWGINTQSLILSQQWVAPTKPDPINLNQLKYVAIDVSERNKLRQKWNQPVIWPLILLFFIMLLSSLPLLLIYYRKERRKAPRMPR